MYVVYIRRERDLPERLAQIRYEHHDLTISTMHAHLDHEQCFESVILRGPIRQAATWCANVVQFWNVDRLASDIGGYPDGRTDLHLHPLEPFMTRLTMTNRFGN